jgi:hypothetical protein
MPFVVQGCNYSIDCKQYCYSNNVTAIVKTIVTVAANEIIHHDNTPIWKVRHFG